MQRSAIDVEGDAIRIDLNRGKVPRRLRGAFDLVVNAGTTEHVANQMNAFRIIHHLVRVGGVMYHELPAGGLIDHGLVGYQPKFFNMLANFNGYEALYIRFTAWGPAKIPEYLRKQNPHGGDTVIDCSIRVALRKLHHLPFVCPFDAGDGAPQPWLTDPVPDSQEPVAAQVAPGRRRVSAGRARVTKAAGASRSWPKPAGLMDFPALFCYMPRQGGVGAYANAAMAILANLTATKGARVQVLVRDNNVDQALKALKKKMQREGIFREMKLRGHYEKPSEKKAREKAEAIRRARKLARKKLQREGLLPMKPKPTGPGGPAALAPAGPARRARPVSAEA